MNEVRAPDKDDVKVKIKTDYLNGMKPKQLSEKYDMSINTIKSWIKRYGWNKKDNSKGAPEGKKDAPLKRKKGAPIGNKNAVGNSGGAPIRNTNAVKHGAYSKIYWDVLDDEEKEMIEDVPTDEEMLLIEQIQLFSIREHRIMKVINKYRDMKGDVYVAGVMRSESKRSFSNTEDEALYNQIQKEKVEKKEILPGKGYQISTTTEATINLISRLEKELTNVQAKKTRCIEALTHLHLEKQKIDSEDKGNELINDWIAGVLGGDDDEAEEE